MKGDMNGKFHAEMQLLEYMLDNKVLPERGFIGVSKPCCTFCQTNLNAAGLHFWTGHGLRGEKPNNKVEAPYTSYKRILRRSRLSSQPWNSCPSTVCMVHRQRKSRQGARIPARRSSTAALVQPKPT